MRTSLKKEETLVDGFIYTQGLVQSPRLLILRHTVLGHGITSSKRPLNLKNPCRGRLLKAAAHSLRM